MGVYAGSERIDSVNVGSKDMVVVMQDNHILALGKKYWTLDLGSYNWTKSGNYFYSGNVANIMYSTTNIYCSKYKYKAQSVLVDQNIFINDTGDIIIVDSTFEGTGSDFKTAMSGVWLVYEFNQTLYAKVDLGSLSYNYIESGNRFTSASLQNVIKIPTSDSVIANCKVLSFTTLSLNDLKASTNNKLIAVGDTGNISIRFTDKGTDVSAFTNAMKGLSLLYEVAE